jgi:hypothetical protein
MLLARADDAPTVLPDLRSPARVGDDGLRAVIDRNILHRDRLRRVTRLAAHKCVPLKRKRAHQPINGTHQGVQISKVCGAGEFFCAPHSCIMDGDHLGRHARLFHSIRPKLRKVIDLIYPFLTRQTISCKSQLAS